MFKKLKEKITEEVRQSPSRISASVSQLTQAVVSPSSSSIVEPTSVIDSHFSISEDVEDVGVRDVGAGGRGFTSVELQGDAGGPPPAVGRSRHSSTSSMLSDGFPMSEAHNSSFHLQSDMESASEMEDSTSSQLPTSSKEQLVAVLRKTQQRYNKYKGRYADLARHYRELERENVKAKTVLSESQDKALRRIAELREQCTLEQRAKAHLEEVLRNDLEEKDHLIMTLNTKIELLRLGDGCEDPHCPPATAAPLQSSPPVPDAPPSEEVVALPDKVLKLEALLAKCKESIRAHKDKLKEVSARNEELQRRGEAHVHCLAELTAARDEIALLHKRDEEAALSLAETKRTIHSEMELKEDQIKHLRQTLLALSEQKDEATRKCLQLQQQVSEAGRPQELDINADSSRQIQELSRAKQEAVRLLHADTERKMAAMRDEMAASQRRLEARTEATALERDRLLADVSALRAQLAQGEAAARLEGQITDLQKAIAELTVERDLQAAQLAQLAEAAQGEAAAREAAIRLEGQIVDLQKANAVLTEERDSHMAQLEEVAQGEAAVREAAIRLEGQIVDLQKANAVLTEERDSHMAQLEEAGQGKDTARKAAIRLEGQIADLQKANAELTAERDSHMAQASELRGREVAYQYSLLEEVSRRIAVPPGAESDAQLSPPLNEMENSECDQHMELERLGEGGEEVRRLGQAKRGLAAALEHRDKALTEWQRQVAALNKELAAVHSKRTSEEESNRRHLGDLEKMHASSGEKLRGELATLQRTCLQYQSTLQVLRSDVADMKVSEEANFQQIQQEFADRLREKECEYSKSISSLELEISQLKTERETLLVQQEKKDIEQKDLLEEVSILNGQLSTATDEKSRLSEEISKLQVNKKNNEEASIVQMKEEFAECLQGKETFMSLLASEISELKNKLAGSVAQYKKKDIEQQDLVEKVNILNEQLSTVTDEKSCLAEELSVLKVDMKMSEEAGTWQMKQEFAEYLKERDSLVSSQEAEIVQLKTKLESALAQHEKKDIELQDIGEKGRVLNEQLSALTTEKSCLAEELSVFKVVSENMERNKKAGIEQMQQEFAESLKGKESVISSLESEVLQLTTKLETSLILNQKNGIEQKDLLEKVRILNEQFGTVTDEKSCLAELLSELKKKNTKLVDNLKVKSKKLSEIVATSEKSALEDEIEAKTKRDQTEELSGQLSAVQQQLSQVLAEKSALEDEIEAKTKRDQTEELTKQLSQVLAEKSALEDEIEAKTKRDQTEELTKQLSQVLAEKSALEDEIEAKTKQDQTEELSGQLSAVQQQLSQVLAEKSALEDEIEAKTKRDQTEELSKQLSQVLAEKSALEDEIEAKTKRNQTEELTKQLSQVLAEKSALEDEIEAKTKRDQTEELSGQLSAVQQQLSQVLAEKSALEKEIEARMKQDHSEELSEQLSQVLAEKSMLEKVLEARTERESWMSDLVSSLEEKVQASDALRVQLLEEATRASDEQGEALSKMEETHRQKIKQLAKDFDNKLQDREEELARMQEDEKVNADRNDGLQLRQLRGQLKAMKSEAHATQQLVSDLRDKVTEVTELREREQSEGEGRVSALRETHAAELAAGDKRWRQCLERELEAREQTYKEEVNALGKEWEFERKELASTSQVAVAAVKSGSGSMDAMRQQLVAMTHQLAQQKAELSELRQHNGTLGHDGSTELEYLRNIVYQYMMGREPGVLAKVITAVLKFNPEQTDKVMQKEEIKQSLLGHLHLL